MAISSPFDARFDLPNPLTKTAYHVFQGGKSLFSLAHKSLANQIHQWIEPQRQDRTGIASLPPAVLKIMNQRQVHLIEVDWQDAEDGVYPPALLFDNPWQDFFEYYPAVWWDLPGIWQRTQNNDFYSFPPEIDAKSYPRYYFRNFHYQTDGYLSDRSANLYDLQVEILFFGAADAMRRRILKPLKKGLTPFLAELPQHIRILDIACGTGRSLKMIRSVFPQASLFGIDLSPAYLRKANQLLVSEGDLPQLAQAQAENLPYQDQAFHGLTSVFLFHELPGPVRQQVIDEAFRVLKPGGCFVICDSIQGVDAPELKVMLDNFPKTFHEPFFTDYAQDDIDQRLAQAGFEIVGIESHFASKYWIVRKPI
jgi:ubiquinone/menaquinone biosynthesis C-methylase UbiE